MGSPRPMDPEQLADMKAQLALPRHESELEERTLRWWLETVLEDRDHWRDRCPVEPSDVEAVGLTYAHLDAFAATHGFAPAHERDRGLAWRRGRSDIGWSRDGAYIGDSAGWPGNRRYGGAYRDIAGFIAMAATELERPAFDILDEMAATGD